MSRAELKPETLAKLNEIKQQLKTEKDLGNHIKSDIYSHLAEVMNRIMKFHPYDGFDRFEEISTLVKETNTKIDNAKKDSVINGEKAALSTKAKESLEFAEKAKRLLDELSDANIKSEDKTLFTKGTKFCIPNLAEQAQMLEWAGVSFGPDTTHLLQKSLKRLATMSGASTLKFFGKILGSEKDYWVAQGVLGFQEEKPYPNQEVRGAGVNSYVYWVTDSLFSDWIQLPDAQPDQVAVAKMVKKTFTGNLNAEVDCCPPFPGKERHLLRAQLARITHATEICPKGQFEVDEETGAVKQAEEFAVPSTDELKSLEAWGHQQPQILKAGRCTHSIPEDKAGDEEYAAKLAEEDPIVERFRALQEDTPILPLEFSWTTKVCGDTQKYSKGEGTTDYAVNVIRSLRWPGAVTVAKAGRYVNIYVGEGYKKGDTSYNPIEPPIVMEDPKDQEEQPEPTPLNEPIPVPEPVTAEGEGGEEGAE